MLLVFSLLGLVASYITYLTIALDADALDPQRREFRCLETTRESLKVFRRVSIVLAVVALLALPAARSWDIYRNVLAYRAINSPTATKAVENANIFMDKLGKFLKDWNPTKEKE